MYYFPCNQYCLQTVPLKGNPMKLLLTTVSGTKSLDSFSYSVPLVDRNNVLHWITAFEVVSISDDIAEVDISGVKHLFSSDVQQKWNLIENRPRSIDLLLGSSVLGLHPTNYELQGNLKLLSSNFGSGFILTGTHPAIKSHSISWNEDVCSLRHSINKLSIKPNYDYFELDNLGVQPPRRCGNCRNCKECSFRGQMLSQQ